VGMMVLGPWCLCCCGLPLAGDDAVASNRRFDRERAALHGSETREHGRGLEAPAQCGRWSDGVGEDAEVQIEFDRD
jgi:hypothetical protein